MLISNLLVFGTPHFIHSFFLCWCLCVGRDTVASVGIIPKRLPFTKANNHIRYFRHAISLDERRVRFKANLWNRVRWYPSRRYQPLTICIAIGGRAWKGDRKGYDAEALSWTQTQHWQRQSTWEWRSYGEKCEKSQKTIWVRETVFGSQQTDGLWGGLVCWCSLWYFFKYNFREGAG